jgi:pyruvate/2-oxoglutarate dehydrogenase complex dihydrolipoamide acyltransferase (E2) component
MYSQMRTHAVLIPFLSQTPCAGPAACTTQVECHEEGVIAKVFEQSGEEEVPVGTPLALICEEQDDVSAIQKALAGGKHPDQLAQRDAVWQAYGTQPSARGCI